MEILTVKEVLSELEKIKKLVVMVLSDLQRKTLIGEINRPETPAEKKPRKRRTKKEIMQSGQRMELTSKVKMDLEKEYQSGRTSDLILPNNVLVTAHDRGSTYLNPPVPPLKTKKERKKKEKKVPVVE